ncbi:MAG: hypothetical protein ACXVAM_07685 [Vulcanimicrobiaceae bacterium]
MRFDIRIAFAAATLALAACSGNFGSGTSYPGSPGMPPMGGPGSQQQSLPMPGTNPPGSPLPGTTQANGQDANGDTAVVSLASASSGGLQCPTTNGYSCLVRFNAPDQTPAPSPSSTSKGVKSKGKQSPSPSPSPSPAASPVPSGSPADLPSISPDGAGPGENPDPMASGAAASPAPSPTPSGPTMTLKVEAQPKDAPAMVHIPEGSLATVPLMDVTMTPSDDFVVNGNVVVQFTLPQEQITNRGFAVQLFEVQTHRKKHDYRAVYTFNKSTRQGTILSFAFTPPKLTVPKGSTYMFVLYGDDHPSATSTPASSASPSAAPSASPSASPSAPVAPSTIPSPPRK